MTTNTTTAPPSLDSLLNDFVQQAQLYCHAKDKKAVKTWETYLTTLQKLEVPVQFRVYVDVIHASVSKSPHIAVLAAQALRSFCKKGQANEDMILSIIQLLGVVYGQVQENTQNPIISQVVLALSGSLVFHTANETCRLLATSLSNMGQTAELLHRHIQLLQSHGVPLALQFAVLSNIPEFCDVKELKLMVQFKGPEASTVLKHVQLSFLCCNELITQQLLPMVQQFVHVKEGNVLLYKQGLLCAANWIKFSQIATHSGIFSEQLHRMSLLGLQAWLLNEHSIVSCVAETLRYLANVDVLEEVEDEYASFMETLTEVIIQLCAWIEAFVKQFGADKSESAYFASFQMMTHLQALISVTEQFFKQQSQVHGSRYDADLSCALDYCKAIVILVADAFEHLQLCLQSVCESANTSAHIIQHGNESLLSVANAMMSFSKNLIAYTDHTMKTLNRNHIHRDCMIKFAREITTSSLKFWDIVGAEKFTLHLKQFEEQYFTVVQASVEQGIHMSQFEDYTGGHVDEVMAEIEATNEYRGVLRDYLRDLVVRKPGIFYMLLQRSIELLTEYQQVGSQRLQMTLAQHLHSHSSKKVIFVEWIIVESILHSFSAVCKDYLNQADQNLSSELVVSLRNILQLLLSNEIMQTRILSRIAVILIQEISTFLIEKRIWLVDGSQEGNVNAIRYCAAQLFMSLRHPEEGRLHIPEEERSNWEESPLFRAGQAVAFRVKQDHIGTVAFLKCIVSLVKSLDAAMALSVFGSNSESMLASMASRVSDAVTPPSNDNIGFVNSLVESSFIYCISLSEDLYSERQSRLPLTAKSFGMSFSALTTIMAFQFSANASCAMNGMSRLEEDTIWSFTLPVWTSILHTLKAREATLSSQSSSASSLMALQSIVALETLPVQVFDIVSTSFQEYCGLHLQLSIVLEIIRAFSTSPKFRLNIISLEQYCSRMLSFSKCILVLLEGIICVHGDTKPLYSQMVEAEVQVLTNIVISLADFYCVQLQQILSLQQNDSFTVLVATLFPPQLDSILNIYSRFCSIAVIQSSQYFVLGAAHSITKLIVTFRPLLGNSLDTCFLHFFQQISSLGVEAVKKEMQEIAADSEKLNEARALRSESIFTMERDSKKDVRRAQDFQNIISLSHLLEFWVEGLKMTDLGLMEINKSSSKQGNDNKKILAKISWTSIGWPVIQTIIDILCDCCLAKYAEDYTYSETTWIQILELLHLCQGPLTTVDLNKSFSELIGESLSATERSHGIEQIGANMIESGRGSLMIKSLLHILENALPPNIRESGIRCLQQTFFTCGVTNAARFVLMALKNDAEEGSTEEKRAINIAGQLHSSAIAGDWKRFKVGLKILFR